MLLLLIPFVSAYFEQKLTRQVHEYKEFDINEKVTNLQPSQCEKDLLEYIHNDTYVSQICFDKNVFYNVEVVLGENVTNETIFNLALDLSSPWTWYKAPTCISCKKMKPLEFEIDDECKKSTKKQCFSGDFKQHYNATKWNDRNVQGQIYSEQSLLQGKFQTDTIQLLSYDSSAKMTIRQWLSYEWGNQTPNALARITGLQMLQVEYINTDIPILADGGLGLGFGYKETNQDKAQMDTDFVEKLVQEKTQLNLTRQQFAIYTYNNKNGLELVLQIGGFDYKYVHKRNENVQWVNNVENSAYYWMLECNEVRYQHGNQDLVKSEIPVKKAILTLNSQFIELPYSWLIKLIQGLESLHTSTKCDLVDSDMFVLYCINIHYDTIAIDYNLTFVFGQNVVPIDNRHLLVRSCNESKEGAMFQNCVFNIKVSTSEYVILGEPFMRNHYIVFENQPGNDIRRIGIMQTALHEYYPENPNVYEWPLFQAILLIFIFGILSICSVTFMRSLCKDLFRSLKYRKTAPFEDQQSLRVNRDIEYVDYSTQEDLSSKIKENEMSEQRKKEDEWKKSQEQFNFGSKFANSIEQNSL